MRQSDNSKALKRELHTITSGSSGYSRCDYYSESTEKNDEDEQYNLD